MLVSQEFPGLLTATQAAQAMAGGWRQAAPNDHLTCATLSLGGAGFVEVMAQATGAEILAVTAVSPWGTPVPATMALAVTSGKLTAFLETSQVAGLHLMNVGAQDPAHGTSRGIGQLLLAALAAGATRVVVGVDSLACHDAGAGILAELGCGPDAALGRGARGLLGLQRGELTGLDAARERLAGVDLVVATQDPSPLLGFSGASATQTQHKGGTPADAQVLESYLGRLADAVDAALPGAANLLTGRPLRLDRQAGCGAGGGVGFALMALGGQVCSAVELCAEAWGVERAMDGCDVVVAGLGLVDGAALQRSAIPVIARWAEARGLPTVVVAGEMVVGRRDLMGVGVCGAYTLAETPQQWAALEHDPAARLGEKMARVASTWSTRG